MAGDGTDASGMAALLLPVGVNLYALGMRFVREVVRAPQVTRIPLAPAMVHGLFNLRGEIVPLLDTAGVTGLGRLPDWSYAAVVETAHGPAGLAASALPEPVV